MSESATGLYPNFNADFRLTDAEFNRIRELVREHTGIALSDAKRQLVYGRLARRLRALRLDDFSSYIELLEAGESGELEQFTNAVTTNLTSFFREAHHFDILADNLRKIAEKRPIRIWCNAASTGEEPYSLAITACEALGSMTPPVQIIASDLDTNVLRHGEQGVYTADRVERMEPARLQKFFTKGIGDPQGSVRVRPELQRLINFRQINLLESRWNLQGPFDAIFCRNVMIYFDKPTQYGILERFAPLLRPDGLLYAGHSENFMHAAKIFRSIGRTVYARTPDSGDGGRDGGRSSAA